MKRTILLAVLILAGLTWILGAPKTIEHVEHNEQEIIIEEPAPVEEPEPVAEVQAAIEPIEAEPIDIVKLNPQGCTEATQWILPDGTCKDKGYPQNTATGSQNSSGSGSCEAEIVKYDWPHGIATAVMLAESGGRPGVVNDNPATGDYSVGCFQVNLYGANARNRPSEAALKNAATNVQWAYNNFVANGRSFIGQWGVCRSMVSCI